MADELNDPKELERIEREKYQNSWSRDSYRERSPAMRVVDEAIRWLDPAPGASFADFGCGTGRASAYLARHAYSVTAVDIAANSCTEFNGPFIEACLWDLPDMGTFDHAICCDVLEHIPPKMMWAVLKGIKDRTRVSAFFQIARFEDAEGLHLCLRDPDWWATAFRRHFARTEWLIQEKYLIARAFPC